MHLVHGRKVLVACKVSCNDKLLFKFPSNNVKNVKLITLIVIDLNKEVKENGKV